MEQSFPVAQVASLQRVAVTVRADPVLTCLGLGKNTLLRAITLDDAL